MTSDSDAPPPHSPRPPPMAPPVISYVDAPAALPFRDRRGGLMACGIIFIVLGALAGCGTLSTPMALLAFAFAPGSMNFAGGKAFFIANIIAATLMYACVATALIWTGIGSIRCYKWVRPVVLVFAVLSMAMSVLSGIGMLVSLPAMQQTVATINLTPGAATVPTTQGGTVSVGATGPQQVTMTVNAVNWAAVPPATNPTTLPATTPIAPPAGPPPAMASAVVFGMIVGVVFMLLFGIGIPAVFFWFYSRPDTRLTLEYFDQHVRWTDGIPVPVLGIAIAAALGAAFLLMGMSQQLLLQMHNKSALIAAFVCLHLLLSAALIFAAIRCYRIQLSGWNIAVASVVVGAVGWCVMAIYSDPRAQLAAMGMNAAQADIIGNMGMAQKTSQIVSTCVISAAALCYLFWCRKFFLRGASFVETVTSR